MIPKQPISLISIDTKIIQKSGKKNVVLSKVTKMNKFILEMHISIKNQ